MVSRLTARSLVVAALLAAAACTGDVNPVRDLVVRAGAGPEPAKTPDFVTASRRRSTDYLPVGTSAPARPTPARTADQVKAEEAALDAVRSANEAAAAEAAQAGGSEAPKPAAAESTPAKPARKLP
jgi:hypothetical protein